MKIKLLILPEELVGSGAAVHKGVGDYCCVVAHRVTNRILFKKGI